MSQLSQQPHENSARSKRGLTPGVVPVPARAFLGDRQSPRLRVPGVKWHSPALLAIFIFFSAYYRWTVQPHPTEAISERGPYNLLADSFLARHTYLLEPPAAGLLKLPDPYDPVANAPYRVHDMSLYKGKYYMYFGPAASLTLFAPFRLLFGTTLPDRVGAALFASGAFIAACLLLKTLLCFVYPDTPAVLYYFFCVVLGFSNVFPFLLRRPAVYEVAIASGQFFLMTGLALAAAAAFSVSQERRTFFAVLAGVALGAATFARPSLGLAGIGLFWIALAPTGSGRERARSFVFGCVPVVVAIALVGYYNYVRFDSPVDFGIHYQLAGINSRITTMFSFTRVPGNGYLFLLFPPKIAPAFPFVTLVRPVLSPVSRYLSFEIVAGILWFSPLLLIGVPGYIMLVRRETPERRRILIILAALPWALGMLLFTLDSMLMATMRYEADFATLFFIPAAIGIAGVLASVRPGVARRCTVFVVVLSGSIAAAVNAAIGLSGYYGGLSESAPEQYQALQACFHFVARVLHATDMRF